MAWIDEVHDIIDTLIPSSPSDYIDDAETRQILKAAFDKVSDNFPSATDFKIYEQCRMAATGNVTSLSGLQTIDGISGAVNDRVFLPYQTSKAQNGIWLMKSGSWIRATDFDSSAEVLNGLVLSKEGDTLAYMGWGINPASSFVLGTSDINVVQAIDFSLDVYADLPDRGYQSITLAAATWTELPYAGDFKRHVCTFFDIDDAGNEEVTNVVTYRYNTTSTKMEAYCEEAWTGRVYMIGITSL